MKVVAFLVRDDLCRCDSMSIENHQHLAGHGLEAHGLVDEAEMKQ